MGSRHEQEPLFAIWDGNGKSDIAFPQNGTRTEKPKQLSRSLGLEWKNPNVILIQGSRKSKIGWELIKCGCYVRSPELSKSHTFVLFKLNIPIIMVLCIFFGLLDQFGLQPPFPVAHFSWLTLISEAIAAGCPKVAAKI